MKKIGHLLWRLVRERKRRRTAGDREKLMSGPLLPCYTCQVQGSEHSPEIWLKSEHFLSPRRTALNLHPEQRMTYECPFMGRAGHLYPSSFWQKST